MVYIQEDDFLDWQISSKWVEAFPPGTLRSKKYFGIVEVIKIGFKYRNYEGEQYYILFPISGQCSHFLTLKQPRLSSVFQRKK